MSLRRPEWSVEDDATWRSWWRGTPKDELLFHGPKPQVNEFVSDTAAVFLALIESLKGTGNVSPNPLVGCVVRSREGLYLGSGGHLMFGGPHAEVLALQGVHRADLSQAKVLVTLEPCCHFGKTPPCAEMLSTLPLREVSYLMRDPNPLVDGRGAALIAAKGIQCQLMSKWSDLAEDVAEVFLNNVRSHTVFVGLKVASTTHGAYARQDSSRLWITTERARQYGHYLRLRYDAILVGARTVLKDNPTLNIRSPWLGGRTPIRIVLDPEFSLERHGTTLNISQSTGPLPWIIVGETQEKQAEQTLGSSFKVLGVPQNTIGLFDWSTIKNLLWLHGVKSVLVEGGGVVWESALAEGAADKIHWFTNNRLQIDPEDVLKISQDNAIRLRVSPQFSYHFDGDEYIEGRLT